MVRMSRNRMSWLLIFILSSLFNDLSEAKHEKKLPSAVVIGTVYCDTCFQQDFSKTSHFISGASVEVECKDGSSKPNFYKEVRTNTHGVFKIQLPFEVSKDIKRIKRCSVKLISSSEPYCAVASSATSSSLHLKSTKEGTHIFSAGFFTFKPLKQPELCNQKPSFATSKEFSSSKTFFPSPDTPILPLLPTLPPLPQLPPLPYLPHLPNLGQQPNVPVQPNSIDFSKISRSLDQKTAHPNFLFPTPPIPFLPSPPPLIPLPPNPFQPSPPSIIPPIFPQPPPAPIFPPLSPLPFLPPIPGLTPSPPPPSPKLPIPFPPLPFPPLPFPPSPIIPGIPPASSSSSSKRTSP